VYQVEGMSEKTKTKHWTYRGERKAVSFKLPVETVRKIDEMALNLDTSKTEALIAAIDMKHSVSDLK